MLMRGTPGLRRARFIDGEGWTRDALRDNWWGMDLI
jgi:hypothetical protein